LHLPKVRRFCFHGAVGIQTSATERRNAVSYCTTILSKDANLYRQAQAGDAEELAQLMGWHEGLVHHIVRQQWRGRLSYEEAIHAGRVGLWRAILGYDPERGNAFSSYASVAIARHVWRAVKEAEQEEEIVVAPTSSTPSLAAETEGVEWEVKATLYVMVGRLSVKQQWVVSSYYGLDGWGGCTLAQLGEGLGCSRQAVHYHLRKALVCLRHPVFSAVLRALLGRNRREDYLQALRPERRQR
jgi:RNA polymerase sigma factor (sigma-70 family)